MHQLNMSFELYCFCRWFSSTDSGSSRSGAFIYLLLGSSDSSFLSVKHRYKLEYLHNSQVNESSKNLGRCFLWHLFAFYNNKKIVLRTVGPTIYFGGKGSRGKRFFGVIWADVKMRGCYFCGLFAIPTNRNIIFSVMF